MVAFTDSLLSDDGLQLRLWSSCAAKGWTADDQKVVYQRQKEGAPLTEYGWFCHMCPRVCKGWHKICGYNLVQTACAELWELDLVIFSVPGREEWWGKTCSGLPGTMNWLFYLHTPIEGKYTILCYLKLAFLRCVAVCMIFHLFQDSAIAIGQQWWHLLLM